eukprot:6207545-Pleurochrysis_carterae.AAC.6
MAAVSTVARTSETEWVSWHVPRKEAALGLEGYSGPHLYQRTENTPVGGHRQRDRMNLSGRSTLHRRYEAGRPENRAQISMYSISAMNRH